MIYFRGVFDRENIWEISFIVGRDILNSIWRWPGPLFLEPLTFSVPDARAKLPRCQIQMMFKSLIMQR